MRYQKIDTHLFINNRQRVIDALKLNAIAIFHANDILPTNGDGEMVFHQNSDLFYVSGIDQEETIVILHNLSDMVNGEAILFLKETNTHTILWEGEKYTKAEAMQVSGITRVYWLGNFTAILNHLMSRATYVYLNNNDNAYTTVHVQTRDQRLGRVYQQTYPLHKYERLAPIMGRLRENKSSVEVALIQEACNITGKGFERVLASLRPGMMEYEIEAILIKEFIRHRAKGFSFAPIIAANQRACILHYTANDQPCQYGDMVLIDAGATYANYNADVSRTIPVNGKFTTYQRKVYTEVLRIMRQAQQYLTEGSTLAIYERQIGEEVTQALLKLGLLDRTDIKNQHRQYPAYKQYFMHRTSHHIGLNTHDTGDMHRKISPGMVLTIEPGIYIKEAKLGIRLENNFLVQKRGIKDLTASIPIEIEEIEALMHHAH